MAVSTNPDAANSEPKSDRERRRHARHPGRATADLVRASDALRQGFRVELIDVSLSGVGILSRQPLKVEERVTIRLQNVVQRFQKDARGIVRWTSPAENGQYRVGIELGASFTALDMQMLKRAGVPTSTNPGRLWV